MWTGGLVRRATPDAKLLVLLRDPIERYRSGIVHRSARDPARRMGLIASDAIERGRYASQLRRLHDLFDPARILVLQYERCAADPVGQFRRTLDHLGLPEHVPDDVRRLRGASTAAAKAPLWAELLAGLHAALDREVADLGELVADLDLSLWPNFSHLEGARAA
ncbi:MAG: sulfotransferase [Solirubrobacteraceae bacterium]